MLEERKTAEGAPMLKTQNGGGPMTFSGVVHISYKGRRKLVFLVSKKKHTAKVKVPCPAPKATFLGQQAEARVAKIFSQT